MGTHSWLSLQLEKNCGMGGDFQLMDDVGVMIVKAQVNACDPREHVLDEDLGETNVGVTILSYPHDIAHVMSIWKWPLS